MLRPGGPAVSMRHLIGPRTYRHRMKPQRESTARTRELGAALRRTREAARYSGHDLAVLLGWSPSKVSRIETGIRPTSQLEVAVYGAFCGSAGDELDRLIHLATEIDDDHWLHAHGDQLPDELRSLIALEASAELLVYYEPMVIPGLVQSENYARALFDERDVLPKEVIESRVRVRIERQRMMGQRGHAPKVTFFIHENALRTMVGNAQIMHEQMLQLILMSSAPTYRVRVVPASVGVRTGASGPFTWTSHTEYNPVVYVENVTTSLFLEGREELSAYRSMVNRLTKLALDTEESGEFLASLASDYDREEGAHDPRAGTGPDMA